MSSTEWGDVNRNSTLDVHHDANRRIVQYTATHAITRMPARPLNTETGRADRSADSAVASVDDVHHFLCVSRNVAYNLWRGWASGFARKFACVCHARADLES